MRQNPLPATVSVRSVRPAIERLRALGLDVAAALAAAGVDAGVLDDPDARVPHVQALAFWAEAARRSGDAAFGLHAAEAIRPGAFDVLDYAMRSSATLGSGLERLVRYHRILHDAAVVRLRLGRDTAELTHELPGEAVLPRHTAEFIVAAWVVVARQATGLDELAPLAVSFRHAAPSELAEHRRLFRAPLRFERAANGIVLDRALLEAPLLKADPGLCAVLERHARALAAGAPSAVGLGERVRRVMAEELARGGASADTVARRLHVSRRTLQRQLGADGTSFRALCEALRRELAMRYLREREIAIAEIAFLLGFSETSAFHRAFKRWSGTTPGAYRAAVTGADPRRSR